jgi:hypothetical protein
VSVHITWSDLEPAYDALTSARGDVDRILLRDSSLSEAQAFRIAFVRLAEGTDGALNALTELFNRVVEAADEDPSARPLEAELGDIVEAGHQYQISGKGAGDRAHVTTWRRDATATSNESEFGMASGEDIRAVAKARLAQIRKLHAEKRRQKADPDAPFIYERTPAGDWAVIDTRSGERVSVHDDTGQADVEVQARNQEVWEGRHKAPSEDDEIRVGRLPRAGEEEGL